MNEDVVNNQCFCVAILCELISSEALWCSFLYQNKTFLSHLIVLVFFLQTDCLKTIFNIAIFYMKNWVSFLYTYATLFCVSRFFSFFSRKCTCKRIHSYIFSECFFFVSVYIASQDHWIVLEEEDCVAWSETWIPLEVVFILWSFNDPDTSERRELCPTTRYFLWLSK